MKKKADDERIVSFDVAAFMKEQVRTAADIASGRITPSEARRRNAEARKVIKAIER